MRVARAPQERAARLAERIERADERKVAQRFLFDADAAREFIERAIRPVGALGDDGLRLRLAERCHRGEPQPHVVRATDAMPRDRLREVSEVGALRFLAHRIHRRAIDIDGQHRDRVPLRVAGDDRRRVEAHRLVVEEPDVELRRVVELEMRGVVRGERERGRVALAEPELGERGDLPEHLVRDAVGHAAPSRAAHERLTQPLHVGARARAAHRAPQLVRLVRGEARDGHRDLEDLLLEEDDAERLLEDRLERGMRVRDRLVSLPAIDVRVDHVPLQRARPDDRDLDDDVREVPRPHAWQRLRLRARFDLEEADRVDLADEVVDRLVVERQRAELEALAVPRRDVRDRILHERERAQPEEVHLHETQVLDVALVELHDVAVGHRGALDGHRVDERLRGDEHAAVVDRQVPREIGDREGELAEQREARALLLVHGLGELLERVWHGPRRLPAVLGLTAASRPGAPTPGVVICGMQRGRWAPRRVNVVRVDRSAHAVDRLVAEAKRLRDLA